MSFQNITRDPYADQRHVTYVKNMSALVVTINGSQVNSKRIRSVIRQPVALPNDLSPQPYINMLEEDEHGKIVLGDDGKPKTYNVYGEITVEGNPQRTTCTPCLLKKAKGWWDKIDRRVGGW